MMPASRTLRLLALAWLVLAASTGFAQAPQAKNATREMMVTVEDYVRLLPPGELASKVREATQAPAALNGFHESWPTRSGAYQLDSEHKSAGAVVSCYLTVAPTEELAQRAADESFHGWLAGVSKSANLRVAPIAGLEGLNPGGRFVVLLQESGQPFANLFVAREGRNVVVLFVRGPMLFGDAASVTRFLSPKLPALLAFTPSF